MAYLSRTKGKTASQARSLCCSLSLVLSCAFGLGTVSAKAESLTALHSEFMPVVVNLVVNSQATENSVVVLRHLSGEWWLPIETLRSLRVRTTDHKQQEFNGAAYGGLNQWAPTQVRFDDPSQSLQIDLPPEVFQTSQLKARRPYTAMRPSPGSGAFFNYDIFLESSSGSLGRSAFTEAGLALGSGVALASFAFIHQPFLSSNLRLNTSYSVDRPEQLSTLKMGDTISRPFTSLGRPVRFGGIQLSTNFLTQPGLVTVPVATLGGQAALPSTLDLYVNQVLQARTPLTPGPFSVTTAPLTSGDGEVMLKLTDIAGREEVISQRYYASTNLLAAGLSDFSLEAGALRKNFGLRSNDYGAFFTAGSYRRGISDRLTLEGSVSAQQGGLFGLLGGVAAAFSGIGSGTLAFGASQSAAGAGLQMGLSFERRVQQHSFHLRTQRADANYRQTGVEDPFSLRQLDTAFYGYRIPEWGSLGLSWTQQKRNDSAPIAITNLSFSTRQTAWGSLIVSWVESRGAVSDRSLNLFWVLPMGSSKNASLLHASGSQNPDQTVFQMQKAPPMSEGWGYRLQAAHNAPQQAALVGQNQYGTARLEAAEFRGNTSSRVGMTGAIVRFDGEWFATRRVDSSFGLVRMPGLSGVGVYVDNQLAARTNSQGYALLPRLAPYLKNNVSIDSSDLPLDVQIDELRVGPVPSYRSGVVIDFPVKIVAAATIQLRLADGHPVPAGALVSVNGDAIPEDARFAVGYEGLTFLTGLETSNRLYVQWPGGSCLSEFTHSPEKGQIPHLGAQLCQSEEDR